MVFSQATSLVLYLLLMMSITLISCHNKQRQACRGKWFGFKSNCQYKCRCDRQQTCDDNGMCASGGCSRGWFGPGCQYVNLIYTNATSAPLWLHDGNESTCNTGEILELIDLTSEFFITWLRLRVNDFSLLHDFQVTFSKTKDGTSIRCENMRNATVKEGTLDIHCDMDVPVRFVNLTGKGISSLCSLYISGGRNVAIRQKATQSSTHYNDQKNHSKTLSRAKNAVDGNINSKWIRGSCMSTKKEDKRSTWNVTFTQPQMIHRYIIYNRDNQKRIIGFTLKSFTKDNEMVFNYTNSESKARDIYRITTVPSVESVSLVSIQVNNSILSVCEVELYGDSVCPPSMYGRECEHTCNCAVKSESCFVSTGGCPSGCVAGFHGERCDQSCDLGKYGQGCKSNCSQFCVFTNISTSPCHHSNGSCLYGCVNGYQTPNCEYIIMNENIFSHGNIAGVLTVVIILLIMASVGIFLWRKFSSKINTNMPAVVDNGAYTNTMFNEQVTSKQLQSPNTDNGRKFKSKPAHKNATSRIRTKEVLETEKYLTDKVYYSMPSGVSSTSIDVRDLTSFMASHDKTFFQQQFNDIPANTAATTITGVTEENKHKNRYKNITAYDHSRVLLKVCKEKKHGDYINASYVDGYKEQGKFIASQGPSKTSLDDFLRMLSEKGVEVIVMLTNLIEDGKTKCERYWPEDDELNAGHIKVKLTTTQVFPDYTIRRLQLLQEGQPVQTLTKFHFTAWPDKDVPTTAWSLVDFEQRVASISTDKPIVVHCSAGVGRTGTFIALHNVLREVVDTGHMDFFTVVQKLRHDRAYMVQTHVQYEFLHRAAQVAMACMGTTVVASNISERLKVLESTSKVGQSNLELEYRAICAISDDITSHRDDPDMGDFNSTYENSQTLNNKLKNRFQNVLAKEDYRVMLMDAGDEGVGDYINAVFLPSFSEKNQQILTQIPLPATVTDFWRMVTQYKVTLVVAFELDFTCAESSIAYYFPLKQNEELSTPYFKIKSHQTSSAVLWDEHRLVITMNTNTSTANPIPRNSETHYSLTHLAYIGNSGNKNPSDLLAFVNMVRSYSQFGGGRTVYMCRNGADYSGLVCVLSLLLDRLDNDHRLTVPLVVGAIKAIRPQVVPTIQQYKLLYQVLKMYNDSNNVSNNFDDASPHERHAKRYISVAISTFKEIH